MELLNDTENKRYKKAPFPYFGGKSRVSQIVWDALGDVKHYLEPFFGSGAVLLQRPNYDYTKHIETICDKNGFVINAWRALKHAADEVANYADYPVSHIDMAARENRLYDAKNDLVKKLAEDEEYYDAKLAGYWIWGQCCSIGLDFGGERHKIKEKEFGRNSQLSNNGQGINSVCVKSAKFQCELPVIGNSGKGVHKSSIKYVELNCKRPSISREGAGIHGLTKRDVTIEDIMPVNTKIYEWFRFLAYRFRYVRIICGDWKRICGGDWQGLKHDRNIVGMFFDPPYCNKNRKEIYIEDDFNVAKEVEQWCIERGKRENYRIVLAGYEEDYPHLLENGWKIYRWSTTGGLSNTSNRDGNQGKINKEKECLFFSPYSKYQGS